VAPDESYLIVSARPPQKQKEFSRLDLFIIFRRSDRTWSKPYKMGDNINSRKGGENCPAVSPDGKYLFFNRYDPDKKWGDMYWVDAKVMDDLKPED
jgi:hypothetical protein